jgi:hypothetical protein
VGRVADQPALRLPGLLQLRQGVVDRDGECGDLVVGAGHGHPVARVARRDLGGTGPDQLDRP